MPRFFVSEPPHDGVIEIVGADVYHIGRSLRMKVGEGLTVCHDGVDYRCEITSISPDSVTLRVKDSSPSGEPNISVTLYLAYPKQGKIELVIQKAVELGVTKVVPFISKRCVARPSQSSYASRHERLKRVALEAAKQCGRGIIPEVADLMDFELFLDAVKDHDLSVVCYENGGSSIKDVGIEKGMDIGLVIGSEGGFEAQEIKMMEERGVKPVWLGQRILRCETAPLVATSIIMFLTDNM